MVSSKMAASLIKRCLSLKYKSLPPFLLGRRWLLSAAYTDPKVWEARETEPQNLAVLANVMDRTYDKNLPVSSLTISRFVDNISSREEVDQAEYYLYKFRHSPNCWYLRDWTIHGWIQQCLKYGAKDKALHTLQNKVQYGIFPNDFTFNLLLDSFIKDKDFKSACSVVEEVMLQEAFDLRSTQILSLYALSNYLSTKPQLTISEERSLGASLLLCGLKQHSTVGLSAQLLGNALLGKVEFLKGIHAVFKGMPLFWARGYLGRALDVMETAAADAGGVKLSKEALDFVKALLQELSSHTASSGEQLESTDKKEEEVDEDDQAERAKLPNYVSRFEELMSQLESRGKIEPSSFKALATTVSEQQLADAEKPDLEEYLSQVQSWEAERRQLIQREKEMRLKAEQEKQERLAARAAAQQA
ncbi:hypothetical protein OJAV_G00087780 [Oryzias javanicus]|uniref:Small ribosomal subunit protein mS27 n=1 Tax=Oryzias javanicus TaxID=123683 RepID=A0A3S2MIW5_ORYJA|nr:hypothetical protein OJAV_G00087780 [Oryzias javanicus]